MIYESNGLTVDFAEEKDCEELARDLREIDKYECYATGNDDAFNAVQKSFDRSIYCYTVKYNGRVIMMFGVCPIQTMAQEYCCWCLATNNLAKAKLEFCKICRDFVEALADKFALMSNWVAVENRTALHWLKWCGFEIGEARRHGLHGEMMRKVVKRKCAH